MKVAQPPSGPPFAHLVRSAQGCCRGWHLDWSVIDWPLVATHGLLVFISALIANLFVVLIGDNRVVAALLATLIFCALFIGWTYYPLGLPGQPGTHI